MTIRPLVSGDLPTVRALIAEDPVTHCFVESRLDASQMLTVDLIGEDRDGAIESFVLLGANIVPVATTPRSRAAFADWLRVRPRRCSSFVGPKHEVLDLWRLLEPSWGPARDVRSEQPLLMITTPPRVPGNPMVRKATRADLDLLIPACVHMFTEEIGVSPYRGGGEAAYRSRITEFVDQGRAFVWIEGGEIVFKAEIGSVSSAACHIQGVWVHPSRRGRGLAATAIAQVVEFAQELAPTVALYVNDFNVTARKAYHRVGFAEHTRFATVLF